MYMCVYICIYVCIHMYMNILQQTSRNRFSPSVMFIQLSLHCVKNNGVDNCSSSIS